MNLCFEALRSLLFAFSLAVWVPVGAAPFARWFEHTQANGDVVRVYGRGDEFSARFEASDGHAVLYNCETGSYEYAVRDGNSGALALSGIVVGRESGREGVLAKIPLHLRDTSAAHAEDVARKRRECMVETGLDERWKTLKQQAAARRQAKSSGVLQAPPSSNSVGTVTGVTILVDFPTKADGSGSLRETVHPAVTKDVLDDLLNGDSFSGYGNYSSVCKYYEETSCGKLRYRNVLVGWVKVPYVRSHYENLRKTNLECGRLLIGDAFAELKKRSDYTTAILPLLQTATVGADGNFKALNVLYAGRYPDGASWGKGLWPHQAALSSTEYGQLTVSVGGQARHFANYQISPVTDSPTIGTFCHESGHLVCGFPDLYDYADDDSLATHGVGRYSLMCGDDDTCPQNVDAYLRAAAGWVTPQTLPTAPGTVTVTSDLGSVWRFDNPNDPTQYYLIENRQQTGRDRCLAGSGIYILRCDESGDNCYSQALPAFATMGKAARRRSYELSIEQADGLYQLERCGDDGNDGDATDPWYAGNRATAYGGVFTADSTPCARWRDGSPVRLSLRDFSANGKTMTFYNEGYSVDAVSFQPSDGQPFWSTAEIALNAASGSQIYYTLDGSTPTASSEPYLRPIVLSATTTVKAVAVKEGVVSDVCSATYVKMDLGAALNASQLTWRNDPTYPWSVQSTNTHDGVAAAQSGWMPLGWANESGIETEVTGPVRMSFRYALNSCPSGESQLRVLVDGAVRLTRISDYGGQFRYWKLDELEIGAGRHTVRFEFVLRMYLADVFNGVCLDEVLFDALSQPPRILPTSAAETVEDEDSAFAFTGKQTIAIGTDDPTADIYFTTNGVEPTVDDRCRYAGPFAITRSTLVKAVAVSGIKQPSRTVSAFYVERHAVRPGELSTDVNGVLRQAAQRPGSRILAVAYPSWTWRFDRAFASTEFQDWAAANDLFFLVYDPDEYAERLGVAELFDDWWTELDCTFSDYTMIIAADSSGRPNSATSVGSQTLASGTPEDLIAFLADFLGLEGRPEATTGYQVLFAPGEGSGELVRKNVACGTVFNLPKNAFTPPEGKAFAGWRSSKNARLYADGLLAFDLAPAGGVVTMTAVWK